MRYPGFFVFLLSVKVHHWCIFPGFVCARFGFFVTFGFRFFIYKQLDTLVPFSSPDCGIFCLYIFVVRF